MVEEIINKIINDNPDSLEIGTPAKGGAIKVYGNYNNSVAFKDKIKIAVDIRTYAQDLINAEETK